MTARRVARLRATAPQAAFVNSTARHPAFVGGFGSGKTQAGILRALKLKLAYPGQDVAYYLPTYDLVAMIGYPRFQAQLEALGIRHRLSEGRHALFLAGRGKIYFRTLDNPERIVGYEVADSVVDELDTLKTPDAEHCWRQIIARNRQKKPDGAPNTVGVATTPEGFRFCYERWQQNPAPGYELIRAATASNARNLPGDYIEALKRSYPEQLVQAYLEGSFVNLAAHAVYPDFSRGLNHTPESILAGEELHIGLDFNVRNCTAVVGVVRLGRPLILAELVKMRDTPAVAATLKETFPGHRMSVYPDASGQANRTVNATLSDITILKDAGFNVRVPGRNPFVKERVMAVNALILNALGARALCVNTLACPVLTASLERQAYDANGEPDKTGGEDHPADALGYLAHYLWPVKRPETARRATVAHMGR